MLPIYSFRITRFFCENEESEQLYYFTKSPPLVKLPDLKKIKGGNANLLRFQDVLENEESDKLYSFIFSGVKYTITVFLLVLPSNSPNVKKKMA